MTVIKKIAGNKNIIKSAVSAAALCGFLYFENKCLTVSEYIAESMKISDKNDGLCIVQVSDLQNTEFGHKNKRLIRKIKSLEPDIIVVTGDIVDCHRTDVYSALDFAKKISKICKVYYVCGNHEGVLGNYKRLCGDLRENGIIVLNNESVYFDKEKNIRITGMTDPYFGFVKDIPSMLRKKAKEDKTFRTDIPEEQFFRVTFHSMMATCAYYAGGFIWGSEENKDYTEELIRLKEMILKYVTI